MSGLFVMIWLFHESDACVMLSSSTTAWKDEYSPANELFYFSDLMFKASFP